MATALAFGGYCGVKAQNKEHPRPWLVTLGPPRKLMTPTHTLMYVS